MKEIFADSTLNALQERVLSCIPERFHYPRVLSVLALNEEVGELLSELSESEDEQNSPKVQSEIGDVLLSCLEISNAYGLVLLRPPAQASGADLRLIMVRLCVATAEVSKACLEIEGFDQLRNDELLEALNHVVKSLAALALSLDIGLKSAFESKFEKILNRISDGTWDRLYGNVLLAKRRKFD